MSPYLTLVTVCIGSAILTSACASAPRPTIESAPQHQAEPIKSQSADEQEGPISTERKPAEPSQEDTAGSTAAIASDTDDVTSTVRYKATLIDLMTAGGTAYIIDYPNSGPMAAADASCSEKAAKADEAARAEEAAKAARIAREATAGKVASSEETTKADQGAQAYEDAEAEEAARTEKVEAVRADCMKQAREKFEADVLRFRRDGSGHIQLVISRRTGSAVKELSVTNVELRQTSGDTVRVEIREAGLGQRPIMKDRSRFDVKIPNGYSIELEDARFGKLPYIAKVGFVAN
jgi:hypothetical protein